MRAVISKTMIDSHPWRKIQWERPSVLNVGNLTVMAPLCNHVYLARQARTLLQPRRSCFIHARLLDREVSKLKAKSWSTNMLPLKNGPFAATYPVNAYLQSNAPVKSLSRYSCSLHQLKIVTCRYQPSWSNSINTRLLILPRYQSPQLTSWSLLSTQRSQARAHSSLYSKTSLHRWCLELITLPSPSIWLRERPVLKAARDFRDEALAQMGINQSLHQATKVESCHLQSKWRILSWSKRCRRS